MSADTIYLNPTSPTYFKNKNIDGLIPTRKQSKEKIGKLNKNPYHKDHFEYDGEKLHLNAHQMNIYTSTENTQYKIKIQKNQQK